MAAVEITIQDRIARVTLDRPPLNVVDLGMARELRAAFERVAATPGLCALVLAARGRMFSAGVDVRDHLPDRGAEMIRSFDRACLALFELELPVIAAVHGDALGGGAELLLACDLVFASWRVRIGFPEIGLGVFPPIAALVLPGRIGAQRAADLVLTGRRINVWEAERMGLVRRARPGRLGHVVRRAAAGFARASAPALRVAKRALRRGAPPTAAELEAVEDLYFDQRLNAPDAIEGLKAFLEKRAPAWPRG